MINEKMDLDFCSNLKKKAEAQIIDVHEKTPNVLFKKSLSTVVQFTARVKA